MTLSIDLNADLGEGGDADAAILGVVTSCNVACGGHAGDARTMRDTVAGALRTGVHIGAHPSYPDREHFGRRSRHLGGKPLAAAIAEQIAALQAIAAESGTRLRHVKPHGALYNDAAGDAGLAELFVNAVAALDDALAVVGLAGGALQPAAERAGLAFVAEGFVDRAYVAGGRLAPRGTPGSVYSDVQAMCAQAVSIAVDGVAHVASGEPVSVRAQTLCIHGDTPNAAAAARAVRDALAQAGVLVRAFGA